MTILFYLWSTTGVATVSVYLCMYVSRVSINRVRLPNPARGQPNKGKLIYFPVPVRALQFSLARRVRPSRPASACSFSTLRLKLVLTHGIPPDFRRGVHLLLPPNVIGSVPSLSDHKIAYRWLFHCRESVGTEPEVLKVVPVTGAAFSGITVDQLMCVSPFPHPLRY